MGVSKNLGFTVDPKNRIFFRAPMYSWLCGHRQWVHTKIYVFCAGLQRDTFACNSVVSLLNVSVSGGQGSGLGGMDGSFQKLGLHCRPEK